jgi:hypothetical protein
MVRLQRLADQRRYVPKWNRHWSNELCKPLRCSCCRNVLTCSVYFFSFFQAFMRTLSTFKLNDKLLHTFTVFNIPAETKPDQSYQELLNNVRRILKKDFSQKPQLSSSHPIVSNQHLTHHSLTHQRNNVLQKSMIASGTNVDDLLS